MNGKQLVISTVTAIVKVVVLIIVIMAVYSWATKAYDFGYRVFTQEAVAEKPGISYSVTLTESTTPKQVAKALEEYGLIKDSKLFYVQYLLSDYRNKFVPGTYQLTTAMTADEMMQVMSQETAADETGAETQEESGQTSETSADASTTMEATTAISSAAAE